MIADVAFDAPVAHPFSYRVPDGWTLAPRPPRPAAGPPPPSPDQLDLVHWISDQSLSSIGSTCAALLPPPSADAGRARWPARRSPLPAPEKPELLVGAGRGKRLVEG